MLRQHIRRNPYPRGESEAQHEKNKGEAVQWSRWWAIRNLTTRPRFIMASTGGVLVILIVAIVVLTWPFNGVMTPSKNRDTSSSSVLQKPGTPQLGTGNQSRRLVPIIINSHPSKCKVYMNGKVVGMTPWSYKAPVGSYLKAILKLRDFKDREIDFKVAEIGNKPTYVLEKRRRL